MENIIGALLLIPIFLLLLQGVTYPFKGLSLAPLVLNKLMRAAGVASLGLILYLWMKFDGHEHGKLFHLVNYSIDEHSLIFSLFYLVIISLVGEFSFRYLHRDRGYRKFFLNLTLLWSGLYFFIWGEGAFFLFAGWELVGISSLFLIGFYHYRPGPVHNSIFIMVFYKVADIVLITSLLLLTMGQTENIRIQEILMAFSIGGILIAASIKAGCFPFSPWLPRAMEGPTPSSAIYYASLSVSVGVLLIFKFLPQIHDQPWGPWALGSIGVLTVIFSSFVSRVQTDAKSALVLGSSVQNGFIFIELAMGWVDFALFHLISGSIVKIYQFLRSPSYFDIHHHMETSRGNLLDPTGAHFEYILPKGFRDRLYRWSYHWFYLEWAYAKIAGFFLKLGGILESVLSPFLGFDHPNRWNILYWSLHYLVWVFIINQNLLGLRDGFVDYVPIFLLGVGLAMLSVKKTEDFIAGFVLYKMVEVVIIHSLHVHHPNLWISVLLVVIFPVFLAMAQNSHPKNFSKSYSWVLESLTLFLMLYFTNFPFLDQSLMNEHLLEYYVGHENFVDLIIYCLANTCFNIAMMRFVFELIYLRRGRGKEISLCLEYKTK